MIQAWLQFKRGAESDRANTVRSLLRFAAIAVVLAIAIIAIGEASRTREESRSVAAPAAPNDPLFVELARCREITPEQLAADDTCRRVWAENRRRFFAPTAPVARTTDTPSKTQDRIPTSGTPIPSDEAR
ncbi:putative entry exclusion protein TrbK-alt [Pseudorhodoplanes sp.]|uniref:putative entry exclusion protein TrbK-alt n=1 Tax=Pseudorhodoplanes sp. TaxID=1934341 RepID=UPI003D13099E